MAGLSLFFFFRLGFASLSLSGCCPKKPRFSAASQRNRDKIRLRDSEKDRSLASAEGEREKQKGRHQQFLSTSPSSFASFSLSPSPKSCPFRTCDRATAASKARDSSGIARGRGGRLGGRRPGDMETPGERDARREKEREKGKKSKQRSAPSNFFCDSSTLFSRPMPWKKINKRRLLRFRSVHCTNVQISHERRSRLRMERRRAPRASSGGARCVREEKRVKEMGRKQSSQRGR